MGDEMAEDSCFITYVRRQMTVERGEGEGAQQTEQKPCLMRIYGQHKRRRRLSLYSS